MGYDYAIIYKNGCNNVAVDDLSQQFEYGGLLFTLSLLVSICIDKNYQEWLAHNTITHLIKWCKKNSIFIMPYLILKPRMLEGLDSSPTKSHLRFHKSYETIKCSFF